MYVQCPLPTLIAISTWSLPASVHSPSNFFPKHIFPEQNIFPRKHWRSLNVCCTIASHTDFPISHPYHLPHIPHFFYLVSQPTQFKIINIFSHNSYLFLYIECTSGYSEGKAGVGVVKKRKVYSGCCCCCWYCQWKEMYAFVIVIPFFFKLKRPFCIEIASQSLCVFFLFSFLLVSYTHMCHSTKVVVVRSILIYNAHQKFRFLSPEKGDLCLQCTYIMGVFVLRPSYVLKIWYMAPS